MTVSNAVAALVLCLVLVLLTLVMRVHARHAMAPVAIHNAAWLLVLAGLGLELIRYREARLESWGILAVGLIFFNVGAWAGGGRPSARVDVPSGRTTGLIGRRALLILGALYAVGFVVYLLTIASRFGIATLLNAPEQIRGAAGESYLAAVPLWARLLMYLGPLVFALLLVPRAIEGRVPLLGRILLIIALGISMLLLLQRTNLIAGLLLAVTGYLLSHRRENESSAPGHRGASRSSRRISRQLLVLAAAAAAGLLLFQVVGNALGKTGSAAEARGVVSPVLVQTGLTSAVGYVSAGVPAFLLLVESTNHDWPPADGRRVIYGDYDPQTWGTATFEPVTSLIPGISHWNTVAPFVDVGIPTNVYTSLEPFYRDFRLPGVVVGSALLGYLATFLYRTRFVSPRRFWLAALIVSTLFLTTFVPKVNSTMYWAIALVIWLVGNRSRQTPVGAARRARAARDHGHTADASTGARV